MKIKTLISTIYLIVVTVLYYFGFCKWDIWLYLLAIAMLIIYMFIFIKQEKKTSKLIELKKDEMISLRSENISN